MRLQTVYEDLPARLKQSGTADQANSAIKDFLETPGRAMELSAGEILFRQDDPGDGMYWIESGLLVAADKRVYQAKRGRRGRVTGMLRV